MLNNMRSDRSEQLRLIAALIHASSPRPSRVRNHRRTAIGIPSHPSAERFQRILRILRIRPGCAFAARRHRPPRSANTSPHKTYSSSWTAVFTASSRTRKRWAYRIAITPTT